MTIARSRSEARASGTTRYFTGAECCRSHIAERFTSSGECIECYKTRIANWRSINKGRESELRRSQYSINSDARKARLEVNARWRALNAEKVKAAQLAYYYDNIEDRRVARKATYSKNRDRAKSSVKEWREKNRESYRAQMRNRKARQRNAEGTHSAADITAIRERQDDRCVYCSTTLFGGGHVDHIKALARGGSNWPSNLQLLCAPCNLSKGVKDHNDFVRLIGAAE